MAVRVAPLFSLLLLPVGPGVTAPRLHGCVSKCWCWWEVRGIAWCRWTYFTVAFMFKLVQESASWPISPQLLQRSSMPCNGGAMCGAQHCDNTHHSGTAMWYRQHIAQVNVDSCSKFTGGGVLVTHEELAVMAETRLSTHHVTGLAAYDAADSLQMMVQGTSLWHCCNTYARKLACLECLELCIERVSTVVFRMRRGESSAATHLTMVIRCSTNIAKLGSKWVL